MKRHSMGRAPDYTTAALVTLGVNLFCLFLVIWAAFGYTAVLVLALAVDRALAWHARHKS